MRESHPLLAMLFKLTGIHLLKEGIRKNHEYAIADASPAIVV